MNNDHPVCLWLTTLWQYLVSKGLPPHPFVGVGTITCVACTQYPRSVDGADRRGFTVVHYTRGGFQFTPYGNRVNNAITKWGVGDDIPHFLPDKLWKGAGVAGPAPWSAYHPGKGKLYLAGIASNGPDGYPHKRVSVYETGPRIEGEDSVPSEWVGIPVDGELLATLKRDYFPVVSESPKQRDHGLLSPHQVAARTTYVENVATLTYGDNVWVNPTHRHRVERLGL